MNALLCSTLWIGALVAAQAAEGPDSAPAPQQPEPCYVVIAVDVSVNSESALSGVPGPAGRGLPLRDEGQLIFLQLLPFLRSDLYIGVTHFSDRVRYSLPSRETGPLLPWGQTFLNESACRNLVKPAELHVTLRPDVAEGLGWAAERIQAARQQYGPGPAKLILLSNGDPRDSLREMQRGSGPLLSTAKQFAEQKIEIYPILMNEAAFRAGGRRSALSSGEAAVEDLMHAIALMTGGKVYQLTPELGFVEILLDVFGLGTRIGPDVVVSRHDWAIVAVGTPLESIAVRPSGARGAAAHALALDGRLEATAGIRSSLVSSAGYRAMVLRRPGARDLVDQFWQGRWTLDPADQKLPSTVRLYRIPDSMIQLEMAPALPWWLNEQVRLRAYLLDRRRETPESQGVPPSDDGRGLSLHMKATLADGKGGFVADKGRWVIPGRVYETEPFTVRAPGLYKLTGELRHAVTDTNAPLLRFARDVYVHPECVSLEVVSAVSNDVLRVAPPTATKLQIDSQGGQQVYFRICGKGEFKVEPLSGILHLEPLPQTQWALRKDDNGNLITAPIPLIEREERLTGSVAVEVRTFAGVRRICPPAFELTYAPALTHLTCTFTDSREALWVGELHRQLLLVSAFPVFDRYLNQTLDLFPGALSGAQIRTVDLRSGTTQVTSPENRLLERPQPGDPEGRTVTATYFVESSVPVPPADKCEIDLTGTIENLQGAVKTYVVVDPVAKGLFEWLVTQGDSGPRQGPIADTLFCGEPIRFFAVWRPDQNVSAVRFEIAGPEAAGSLFVDMPVAAGTNKVQLEQVVSGLTPGEVHPLYVHVTMQPARADRPLLIKLKGGQFRAEDRRIVLTDLTVGGGTPTDIPGYLWEPVQVPLEALFRGYKADDPAHNAAIEQFKKSCVVTVTSKSDVKKTTDAIEWTSLTPAEGAARTCRLIGHVTCTPEVLGRLSIELNAEAPLVRGVTGRSSQRALAHILVKEPRLAIAVSRLKPGGEEPVFDSRNWVKGPSTESPLTTRLSTRLRVDVQTSGWIATGQTQPWRTTLRLLRRPAPDADWVAVLSERGELASNRPLTREVQIAENGQYALEVAGQDPQSNRPTAYVLTPVIASIQPHEVMAAVPPPSWLTSRVRQWPFEYHVTLYQDAVDLSRLQALAFQFQLPSQSETWLDGATSPLGPETTATRQLSAKSPRLLPAAEALRDGIARFRLSSQGLEVLRWECPNIRVVPPVLEGLTLSGAPAGAALASEGGRLTLDGSRDLWVRPRFRVAPELEGQWSAARTVVYLWRNPEEGPAGKPADVRVLERLQEHGKSSAGPDLKTFDFETKAGTEAVEVLSRRTPRGFWGWPKRAVNERYSLVASVVYRPQATSESPAGAAPADRMLAEWSDLYTIHLDAPWAVPLCWWPIAAVLLMAIVATVLRVLVPSPSRLALDMRLEDNVAIVEPVRLDNPVLVDLKETPLAEEMVLYARYLCGRWDHVGRHLAQQAGLGPDSRFGIGLGRFLQGVAAVVAPIRVLLRRSLYPRRWAWAAIIPRIRGNAALVRTGLLCVWTGLGARRGRVWSSQAGSLALPDEGQTRSIDLDLPYRIDSVDRTMRVTVRVRRMGAEEIRTTAANRLVTGQG
jgi:hypothetical protein